MSRNVVWLTVAVTLLLAQVPAFAEKIIYFQHEGLGTQPRGFYDFDTDAGTSTLRTLVGGAERFYAADVRPSDGKVFVSSATFSTPTPGGLFTINVNTGAYSLVGLTGITELVGLAFHPTTGALYQALRRLADEGLIQPADGPGDTDARRNYFALTRQGRRAAAHEAGRLDALVRTARQRKLYPQRA